MLRSGLFILAAAVTTGGGLSCATAAPITYAVNQTIGLGSVTGTIETDGTTGTLSFSDITGFALTLNGVGLSTSISSADSAVIGSGLDLTATAAELRFNYSGTDSGYLLFQKNLFSGSQYYCSAAPGNFACLSGATVTPDYITASSTQNALLTGDQVIGTAVSAVPLPASSALFGAALGGLGFAGYLRGRRRPAGGAVRRAPAA